MYKSKLQELCHRRSWNLPDYQTVKEGPNHNPRYVSTITVNSVPFQTPVPCRTAKESQNNVAKLALDHFNRPRPSLPDSPASPSLTPESSSSNPISAPSEPQPQPETQTQTQTQPSFSQPSFPQTSFTLPQPSAAISAGSSAPGTAVDAVVMVQPNIREGLQGETPINMPITSVNDNVTAGNPNSDPNMQRLYKNQLQNFAQKRNKNLPVYSSEREGPPHASRFKCTVTIDEQTFESPGFFPTLKDAEHAAAKAALMSLSQDGAQEDDIGLYKNLLQEFLQKQKQGSCLPIYSTSKFGEAHIPTFVSTVDINGEPFTGQEAKTKKQAEMSAAKVAYTILKERKGNPNQSSVTLLSPHQGQAPVLASPSSETNVPSDLQNCANQKHPLTQNQSEKDEGCAESKRHHTAIPFPESSTATVGRDPSSDIATTGCDINAASASASLWDVQLAPSLPNIDDPVKDSSGAVSTSSTAKVRRVRVFSRKANVEIPQGGTMLPISDENWVAYSYPE